MKKTTAVLLMLTASRLFANIAGDLDNFVNGLGYASNATSPAAFESQAAGFFGGGSLYARDAVRQYQLVSLDLPSYRAGCAGIDLYMGSLSFLSEDKLVDLGKSVMSNGGAYAVDVMLASTVPELKQVRDYLQQLEQTANHASVNSCEMAQNFVGGVWPKTAAAQQKICKDQGTKEGLFADYVNARMKCAGEGFEDAMNKAEKDGAMKKQMAYNKNLVWEMLQSSAFLSSDTELAELVMSLTGTTIIDKQGKVTQVPSLAANNNVIQALLGHGASVQIWTCKEKKDCMAVELKTIDIPEKSTLSYRVRDMIQTLNAKLRDDQKPDAREINFLSMTSLPVLKFLMVLNSSQYAGSALDIEEYSDLIAQDLLNAYLGALMNDVANTTASSQIQEDLLKDIEKRITNARREIAKHNPQVGRRLKEKLALIENMARIEKQLAGTLSA